MRRQRDRNPHNRRSARRRAIKKIGLLLQVLGGLSLVIAVLLAGFALLFGGDGMWKLALIYGAAGAVMLVFKGILISFRHRPHERRRRRSGEPAREPAEGGVLILTMVMLGLIAGLLLQAHLIARSGKRLEDAALLRHRLRAAASDAILHALRVLANDEDLAVDHVEEEWAVPRELEQPAGPVTLVRITDENSRFDLNNLYLETAGEDADLKSPETMLMDILTLCGDFAPAQRTDALRDWIDPDREGFREDDFYSKQSPAYTPPNTWLHSRGELLHIDGFGRDLFRRNDVIDRGHAFSANLEDCVTVVPGRRRMPLQVNVNTASKDVLLGVLGIDREALVEFILVTRKNRPIRSLSELAPEVGDPLYMKSVYRYVSVGSSVFSVHARAYYNDRSLEVRALVRRSADGTVRVLRWLG